MPTDAAWLGSSRDSWLDDRATVTGADRAMNEFLDVGAAGGRPPIYILSSDVAGKSIHRTPAKPDNASLVDIEAKTIPVGPKGSTRIVVVRPHGIEDRLPVVVYFHGVDWIMAGFDIYQRLAHDIACNGREVVVFVRYHRSRKGQYRIAIEEAYSATKYVAEHADEFNVDTTRLAIAGDGVGANLVAAVGLLAKERIGPPIRVQLLLYAVNHAHFQPGSHSEFTHGPWLTRYVMKWFWPLHASLEQLGGRAPVLIIADENDALQDHRPAYANKLVLPEVTIMAVRHLRADHDFIKLNGLSDTLTARSTIAFAAAMLRHALSK
jgi:acetyl esterase